MAIIKRVLCPERLRKMPRAFSWIDHRLVRDGHISRCSHEAVALYLFLITVADAEGLSYYSDAKAGRLLNMDLAVLISARRELRETGLIAYRRPLYQVLSLDPPAPGSPAMPAERLCHELDGAVSIAEVLRHLIPPSGLNDDNGEVQ